jgi:hypothetical protein
VAVLPDLRSIRATDGAGRVRMGAMSASDQPIPYFLDVVYPQPKPRGQNR